MQLRRFVLASALTFVLTLSARSQQANPPATETTPTITKETGLVIVDTVVTDKQGNYIRDLTQKDFRVFEDGKEQTVKSFSSESNATAPTVNPNRYLVLFFDNSTMKQGDQATARAAALKFIASNGGPNRYMAIVNFGGTLQIAQNFTTDVERLKAAAQGLKQSSVSP
ncbi:MAG: VWA domain-containing protein, partial [Candidatus Korobacteraceae bacterium]